MATEKVGIIAVTEDAAKKVVVKNGGKIKAHAGTKYLLQVDIETVAPENVTVKRVGNDLEVSFEGSDKPDLTIQGFFAEGMDSQLYGVSEDGQLYAYVRTDGEGFYGHLVMADGESAPIALGGDSLGAAPLVNGEMDDAAGFLLWPLLAGAAALAGGAYAYHEHNKDDKKHHDKTSPEPTNIKVTDHVGPIQGDLSEGAVTDDNRPAISGDGVPGAVIHIIDNGVEIGSTTVNPDGHWDFVPTTDLSDDGHSIDVTQEVPGEKPSAPVHVIDFVVDTIPPAAPEAHLDPASDSGVKGDDITNDTRPTIDGKTEPGADITVTFPTGEEIHTKADENGDWSVTPTQPLPEGNNDITVIATDPAGNQSEPTVLPIEIDTTPPKAPDAWLDPDSDTGIKGDDITSDTKPTIDGKTEPGADVTVTFPTGEEIHTRADENGDWSVTPTQPLPEGNNDITVTATDPAGNQSEPTVLPIVIDTSGPDPKSTQLTIDVVAGDDIVNQFESTQEQIISGQAKGEFQKGDIVSFTLNGHDYSAAVAADGSWSVKVAGADLAAETSIHATLVAHDAAGNAGNIVADHGYRVDIDVPTAPTITGVVDNDDPTHLINIPENGSTNDTTPVISGGGAEKGDIIHVFDGATELGSVTVTNDDGSWSFEVPADKALSEGEHDFTVKAEDPAGNVSPASDPYPINIDITPPDSNTTQLEINVVAGDDIVNLAESKEEQTISGQAKGEFQKGDIVSFTLNGHGYSAAVAADGSWSVKVAGSDLAAETNIHATLVAHDAAGNAGNIVADHGYRVELDGPTAPTITGVVDNDDPAHLINIPENGSTNDTTPVISGGGAEKGDIIHVFDGATELGSVTVTNDDGSWSFEVPADKALSEGEHDFTVKAEDPAGNVSPASDPYPIHIDTTAPAAPTITGVVDNDDPAHLIDVPKDGSTNDTTPVISGGGAEKGDIIHVFDGATELGSVTVTKDDGTWSFEVPADKALDEGEHDFTVKAEDPAGNISPASDPYPIHVDITPPVAQLNIDVVAGDDVLNLEESKVPQTVSGQATGEFRAGDIVSFKLNGTTYSAAVAANGKWSVEVAGSDLAKATNIHATLIAHDVAGNTASVVADHPYTVAIDPQMPTLSIHVIAGDDVVNLAESQENQAITGGSTGGRAGDIVKVVVNGVTYSGTIDAKGDWSINVPGAGLAADAAHQVVATLTASDAAGNITPVTESRHYDVDTTPPVAQLSIDKVTGDDIVNLDESKVPQIISGKATGEFQKGDIVSFTLNGHDYSAAVAADGKWSVTVAGADLAAATNIHATLVAHDTAGNPTDVVIDHGYQVILTPPQPSVYIDPVAGDGVINLAESQENQAITGGSSGGRAGDVISIVVNDVTYSTTIDANGKWSITVPGSELVADTDHHIDASFVATDIAGNTTTVTAGLDYDVDLIPPVATLEINVVAGDDIVNASEANTNQTISGKAGGEFLAGDLVTFTLNGTDYSAKVAADGTWSVQVSGTDLAKGSSIDATLVAHDAAGNSSTATANHPYTVDLLPPVAQLSIDPVTGDDIVNQAESTVPQVISGKATGEFLAGDIVSFKLNGTSYSAAVAADGKWSVTVAGADLAKESSLNIHATLIAHDVAGNTASVVVDHPYLYVPIPGHVTLTIDVVAGDDIVNLAESKVDQTISGKADGAFKTGDLVSFRLNGHDYSAAVAADGKWSVDVAGADLAKETNIHATLVAHDAAGNISSVTADHGYAVDLVPPVATLTIDTVAGDDIVNQQESTLPQTISGKAEGEFKAGDIVSFSLNGHDYSAAVAADGKWSVTVAGADLAKETNIHATLVAHDAAGNSADVVADHAYTVNPNPPIASININIVAGDDVVNLEESKVDQAVTGSTTGGLAGNIVKIVVNGVTYSGTIDADGKWSINVPGSELVADADHRIDATFFATNVAGNSATATANHNYSVDITPPVAQLIINTVAGDDVVNLVESQSPQTISGRATGEFMTGDLVKFTLNGHDYSAAVNASGNWSVTVAGADLAKETNIHATLEAHDTARNAASVVADHGYSVDIILPVPTLTIDMVAGDDILNYAESQTQQIISGKAGGEFKAGDIVSFALNGHDYSAAVAADGKWSVTVAGSDLAEATNIHATLVAHDEAGNEASVTADHPYEVKIDLPVAALIIDMVTADNVINIEESKVDQTITGKATGQFKAGDIVSFSVNGHLYSAAVAADGKWSVDVAGADLAKASVINATLVAHDDAGNASNVPGERPYSVDLAPPVATLTIDKVAGDDIVNLEESKAQQTISGKAGGEFKTGDLVTFTLNGHDYSAAVAADGKWNVTVAGADLAAETNIHATLVAHDAAGNSASVVADHGYTVDITPPVAQLIINVVAGDDIVNAAEAMTNQTISGKATGEFVAGDIVSFKLNGTDYNAAVSADGSWSVQVSGTDLSKGTSIDATLVAHDVAGNSSTATASHPYTVDLLPPDKTTTQLTINTVAGDDILNLEESKTNQIISGKATGEFQNGDIVSFTLNGHTYSVAVNGAGDWSVSVAGSDLAEETNIHATLMAKDIAGNIGPISADHAYQVILDPTAVSLSIDVVAGDDIVNLAESKVDQTISGKASGAAGAFKAGDIVSFKLNGHDYSAAVAADGKWSVTVAGADLAKETNIHATLVAHDTAGNSNTVTADHAYRVDLLPPDYTTTHLSINVVAGDDIVNLDESKVDQTVSGKVTGEFTANDVVSFKLNGTTYSAAVAADGTWSVKVAGADLVAESTHNIHATVVAHDAAGNPGSISADHGYSVDITPPVAQLTINVVAGDDIVNLDESKVDQTVSGKVTGEFTANDVVSFKLNGTTYSAAVAADGTWSVKVAGADLVAESTHNIHATVVAHDAAGNPGSISADHGYSVDIIPPVAQLTIDVVAGDDIVNLEESKVAQTISGKASGEFKAGDIVSFKLNGTTYSAAVAADGKWSVDVAGANLAGEATHNIHATLVAHDAAGNAGDIVADHAYQVQIVPPVASLTILTVAGDDIVDSSEAASASNTVTGTSTGARAGDVVTLTINGKAYSGTVAADGKSWTVSGIAGSDLVADSDHVVDGKLHATDAAGNYTDATTTHGYEVKLAPEATVTITGMDKDSGVDVHDWLTNNGAAGRLISGAINGTLGAGEKVQVSTDGGTTWTDAYVSGSKWDVMDPTAHSSSWTIQARVVNADAVAGEVANQAVSLDTVAPSHATGLSYASNVATVAFNGADKQVGDLVDVIVGGKHFSHSLTAAEIAAGSANVAVTGATSVYDIQVALVDRAGNVSDYLSIKSGEIKQDFDNQTLDLDRSYPKPPGAPTGMALGSSHDLGNLLITLKSTGDPSTTLSGVTNYGTTTNLPSGVGGELLSVRGVLDVDLKGATATSMSAYFYSLHSTSSGQYIRFYNGNTLVDTWNLYPYATASGINSTYSHSVPAGFTRFEFISGSDWVGLDNLVLNAGAPDSLTYAPADNTQTVVAGSTDYYGDAGDNTFSVADVSTLSTTGVHGNGGLDTLKLTGAGQTLNVSALIAAGKLDGIEVLDITGSGNNTVNLKLGDVLHLGEKNTFVTDNHVQLMVKGNAGDVVNLSDVLPDGTDPGNWAKSGSQTVGGVTYDVYQFTTTTGTVFNNAEVLVQQGVAVNLTTGVSGVHMALAATADDSSGSEHLAAASSDPQAQTGHDLTPQDHDLTIASAPPTQIHEIQGLSDTFFGAPSESKVVSLWASASDYLASDANQGIHGGNGVDVLKVEGHDQVLDLTSAHGKITGMEVIDLSGDGANTLKLSLQDVLDNGQADLFHSTDKHSVQMMVQGNSDDVVNLDHQSAAGKDGTWSDKGTMAVGEVSYHVYQNSTGDAELLIQQGVQVHLV